MFAATTCPGEQEAIAAYERAWVVVEEYCDSVGSGAVAVFARFVMVTVMSCVTITSMIIM